jgi:hypothetical protein
MEDNILHQHSHHYTVVRHLLFSFVHALSSSLLPVALQLEFQHLPASKAGKTIKINSERKLTRTENMAHF